MAEDENKLPKIAGPLTEREAHLLVVLMPLVLVGDIAAFALCFWWYDFGLPLSIFVSVLTPIVLLFGIVMLIRLKRAASVYRTVEQCRIAGTQALREFLVNLARRKKDRGEG